MWSLVLRNRLKSGDALAEKAQQPAILQGGADLFEAFVIGVFSPPPWKDHHAENVAIK